jgi:hypothetical protein
LVFHTWDGIGTVGAVQKSLGGGFFMLSATSNPHLRVAASFWILYNLERNQHFHNAYYYDSEKYLFLGKEQ